MKVIIFTSFFSMLVALNLTKPHIEIKILDPNIQSGKFVNVELKNNTQKNYCFVLDTSFCSNNPDYYGGEFFNPRVFLSNLKGNYMPIIREIKDHIDDNELSFCNKKEMLIENKQDTLVIKEAKFLHKKNKGLSFLIINAGKSIRLKIPFSLVVKYSKENEYEFYDIDKKEKYNGSVEYVINKEFININCTTKLIDSIKNRGCVFFTGKLSSNKVPLILKRN